MLYVYSLQTLSNTHETAAYFHSNRYAPSLNGMWVLKLEYL